MRRFIALVLTAVLMLSMLCACADNSANSDKPNSSINNEPKNEITVARQTSSSAKVGNIKDAISGAYEIARAL